MAASPELREIVGRMLEAGESEQDIAAVIQRMTGADPVPPPSEPKPEVHPLARVGQGGIDALKAGAQFAWKASGVPGFVREGPIGAIKDQAGTVRDLLMAQFDQYQKAKAAEREGRTSEMVGHSVAAAIPVLGPMAAHAGEQIAAGKVPELIGEVGATALTTALPAASRGAVRGARSQWQARAARKAGAKLARAEGDVLMALPPSKSVAYTVDDLRTAKPYLNAQHEKAPITSVSAFKDAADEAIREVESQVGGIVASFPEARLNPWERVSASLQKAFGKNPRADALRQGLRELDDLPLNTELTLPELDTVRLQLNAENRAILRKNNYDQATARRADPAFAAREAASEAIRDTLYDYLGERGVPGVRELRRDEGALIKVRNAAERQIFAGGRPAPGASEPSAARKVMATMVEKGSTAVGGSVAGGPGAVVGSEVGQLLGQAIRGSRPLRDDLIARAFGVQDAARPVYPTVPPRSRIVGELPPAPIELGAVPDTSYVVSTEAARNVQRDPKTGRMKRVYTGEQR